MRYVDYLNGAIDPYSESIRLFPLIDEEEDTPVFQENLRKARFRWYKELYEECDRQALYEIWENPEDSLLEEWFQNKDDSFYSKSEFLPVFLLKREVSTLTYFKELRDTLRIKLRRKDRVLVVGPTAGGELEAIDDAGGIPCLVAGEGVCPWYDLVIERAAHDSVSLETYTYEEFLSNTDQIRYFILSSYVPDVSLLVKMAKMALGAYGFLFFEKQKAFKSSKINVSKLLAIDEDLDRLGVYFKHRGLD